MQRGFSSINGIGSPKWLPHYTKKSQLVATKESISGSDRKMPSSTSDDRFVLCHLSTAMEDLGLAGLLCHKKRCYDTKHSSKHEWTQVYSAHTKHAPMNSQIPLFEELRDLIESKLANPSSGIFCGKRKDYSTNDNDLGTNRATAGRATSLVMDLTIHKSSSEEEESDDNDLMVDISSEEVVQFIQTHVNLAHGNDDSDDSSSCSSTARVQTN